MEAALTVLLDDGSPDVRYALADAFASSDKAPRHIIIALAAETTEIAALVLSRSPVFIDAELVDIVAAAAGPLADRGRQPPDRFEHGRGGASPRSARRTPASRSSTIPAPRSPRISYRRMAERFGEQCRRARGDARPRPPAGRPPDPDPQRQRRADQPRARARLGAGSARQGAVARRLRPGDGIDRGGDARPRNCRRWSSTCASPAS